jgi:D-sedoheptulose 7-phosphate isomerase
MAAEAALTLLETRIRESVRAQEQLLDATALATIARAADAISLSLRSGGKLIAFGNGGSAADATHVAAEFVGRFLVERRALPALSLTDNSSSTSAIGNDYGFERVFARQVEAFGAPGDVALAISTSGRSANVLAGARAAQGLGMRCIALTGTPGGPLADAVDIHVAVASDATPRIQEAHMLIGHLLCELVEQSLT